MAKIDATDNIRAAQSCGVMSFIISVFEINYSQIYVNDIWNLSAVASTKGEL
jgi:hypothetical protein